MSFLVSLPVQHFLLHLNSQGEKQPVGRHISKTDSQISWIWCHTQALLTGKVEIILQTNKEKHDPTVWATVNRKCQDLQLLALTRTQTVRPRQSDTPPCTHRAWEPHGRHTLVPCREHAALPTSSQLLEQLQLNSNLHRAPHLLPPGLCSTVELKRSYTARTVKEQSM